MRIRYAGQFKKDFKIIENTLRNKNEFRAELRKFIAALAFGKPLTDYVINELLAKGSNWYDCYVYQDIVIIYHIDQICLTLQRIGRIKDLYMQ